MSVMAPNQWEVVKRDLSERRHKGGTAATLNLF